MELEESLVRASRVRPWQSQQPIYLGDADRLLYLGLLGHVVVRQRWRCLAYCLMANHVHCPGGNARAEPRGRDGSAARVYAQMFNARHRAVGHLFQGRFGSVTMRSDEQLLQVARYVVRNPVEGGLCDGPGDWAWSSHAATLLGGDGPVRAGWTCLRLLAYFGAERR